MLIDASHCCDDHANQAVEDLFYKAASDPTDPWEPHYSPFVRQLIELFTQRGLLRIGSMQLELQKWLDGERYKPGQAPTAPPAGFIPRWTPGEMAMAKLYLEALPPNAFTADDWMLCIEWLRNRYFPADELFAESEWLATKAALMGRVQARMAEVSSQQADALLAAAPSTVSEVAARFGMSPLQSAMLQYGRARCAENIVTMADGLKHRLKAVVLEYQRGVAMGDPTIRESLQTRLLDTFGIANTDMRRIAVTEAGEMANQGMIASLKPGARVRRLEQYKGACSFCRKIDGMEFDVVPPGEAEDGWKQVWVGKSNVGRSAAPRKRVGGELVERLDAELWWPAAGTQHPHCRGTWLELHEPDSAGDEDFTAWMKATLENK